MIQPSCVSLTESDLCHQPAFPNTFYHTMQSYVLQVFEIVTTTAAERRTSNRSNPAGSNIQKKRYPSDISSFSHFFESTRRDSNPRPSPWQGDTPPLSHSCMSFSCLCSLEQYILYRIKKDLSTEKLKKFIFFNFSVIYHQLRTKYSRNGMEGELDK